MAKKGKGRKGTKRSTKAQKRQPSTKRVAARRKRAVFQPGVFQPGVFQTGEVPSPAPQPMVGEVKPSEVPLAGVSNMAADTFILPAPVPVTPTVYPDSPHGTVIVNNHITINIRTDEFRHFNTEIELLIRELRYSNEISGEVRDQLLSELKAGREIITGPKPQRNLVDLFLVRPLKWLAEKSGSAIVSKLAADALAWLLKIIV